MPKQVSARSWLYSWGDNSSLSSNAIEQSAEELGSPEDQAENDGANISVKKEANLAVASERQSVVPSDPVTVVKQNALVLTAPPSASKRNTLKEKQSPLPQHRLKHKTSARSLVQYSPSKWLGWTSKTARSNSLPGENSDTTIANLDDSMKNADQILSFKEDKRNDIEEIAEPEAEGAENANDILLSGQTNASFMENTPRNSNYTSVPYTSVPDTSVPDTSVPDTEKDPIEPSSWKKSWGFWNSTEKSLPKKETLTSARITNTILKSTPSLSFKNDSFDQNLSQVSESRTDPGPSSQDGVRDDAVLYEPHQSATELRKINTHNNENLSENILVPNWQTCLPMHEQLNDDSTSSDLQFNTGSKSTQAFDIKHWKNYFSNISVRLGLTAGDANESDKGGVNHSNPKEDLYNLQERSYMLYGKSLSRLPPHKRACLPNPNHYYAGDVEQQAENGRFLLYNTKESTRNPSGVFKTKVGSLSKIRKILIIGVHGFFPTRMIRPIIGAPKGTSSKFAAEAEKAVIRYLIENDMMSEKEDNDLSIQKIALEKEGKIFDRVEFFSKILTKWEKELNEADFIFIASHSQGCVVSIILLDLLIKKGILKRASSKRIGILGMAGIHNGPFYGVDKTLFMKAYSAIEHDSMMELFELTKFDSAQSIAYKDAVQTIVGMNVKLCLVGSVNDQLVPLYSALASHIFHPNIYRACYIDSSSKTPEFIKQLINFCCQLQNTGYFDNNVIKEISPILAGPLTGSGHSKIYNDGKVYDLGIKFVLDTDDIVIPKHESLSISQKPDDLPITNRTLVKEYNVGKIGTNPFILPWCLHGLIFNVQKNWRIVDSSTTDPVSKSACEEINLFYDSFDSWRPETKALKDLKFRLSGIRVSKL